MVDAPDLKSVVRMGVGVQVPPLAPRKPVVLIMTFCWDNLFVRGLNMVWFWVRCASLIPCGELGTYKVG